MSQVDFRVTGLAQFDTWLSNEYMVRIRLLNTVWPDRMQVWQSGDLQYTILDGITSR